MVEHRVEHNAIGAGHVVEQAGEGATAVQFVHSAGGVLQAGLPLVGEVQVACRGEHQVVYALEAF